MREIALSKGYVALVDDADFDWLNQWKWTAVVTGQKIKRVYAYRRANWDNAKRRWREIIYMHRLIANVGIGGDVDHWDKNTLNNQRGNLRPCTRSQNLAGARRVNKHGYRGVRQGERDSSFWMQLRKDGKLFSSRHPTAEDAARAYDEMARKLHGQFARLNFPTE